MKCKFGFFVGWFEVCGTSNLPSVLFAPGKKNRKSTRSVPSRQGHCREAAKGFNFVRAKPPLWRAESRFAEPRFSFWDGFNFVSANFWFGCADSRFAKPRTSRKGNGFILFACTKRTGSTPEVCEPLDSGDDSNLRSIRDFRWNDRRSSCNRSRWALQGFRVSPVRIWIGAKELPLCWRKTAKFRKRDVLLQAHSRISQMKFVAAR